MLLQLVAHVLHFRLIIQHRESYLVGVLLVLKVQTALGKGFTQLLLTQIFLSLSTVTHFVLVHSLIVFLLFELLGELELIVNLILFIFDLLALFLCELLL